MPILPLHTPELAADATFSGLEVNRDRKNLLIEGQRTTISLERAIWDALVEICRREEISLDELCDAIAVRRGEASISSALRIAALLYFRNAAESAGRWLAPLDTALDSLSAGAHGQTGPEERLRA